MGAVGHRSLLGSRCGGRLSARRSRQSGWRSWALSRSDQPIDGLLFALSQRVICWGHSDQSAARIEDFGDERMIPQRSWYRAFADDLQLRGEDLNLDPALAPETPLDPAVLLGNTRDMAAEMPVERRASGHAFGHHVQDMVLANQVGLKRRLPVIGARENRGQIGDYLWRVDIRRLVEERVEANERLRRLAAVDAAGQCRQYDAILHRRPAGSALW
jgi:hypothetical protein